MKYTIERVKPGDEEALAYIQTESWKAGFKDMSVCDAVSLISCVILLISLLISVYLLGRDQ